ncbi:MAG: efflux RND transporter periplasmic adaptor subunit [Planctomycetes bacterium]|nr:efflux RND transporter periplasmic adaptor subunit [Planctomycetota bacterium]
MRPSKHQSTPAGLAGRLALAAVVSFLVTGCSKTESNKAAAPPPSVPVVLGAASTRTVLREIEVVGTLWGDEDTQIAAKVAGKIVALHKDIGDTVVANAPLVQIEKTDYALAVNQKQLAVREALAQIGLSELPKADFDPETVPTVQRAKFQAQNARAKFNRGKMLFDQQMPRISEQEFDDLRTAVDVAERDYAVAALTARAVVEEARSRQGDLDIAAQHLRDTTILAPDDKHPDGTPRTYGVAGRMVSVGEYIKEGVPLFRLVDDDLVKLRAPVPERYANQVAVGQKVRLNVESSAKEFWGTVSRINPQIDPDNRTFQVEFAVPNPDRALKPGAFAHARVQTKNDTGVVFVPQEAVTTFAGVNKVFVIKDGKAQEVRIDLGEHSGDSVEVTRGLSGAEQVVVAGTSKLATGVAVEVRPAGAVESDATRPDENTGGRP